VSQSRPDATGVAKGTEALGYRLGVGKKLVSFGENNKNLGFPAASTSLREVERFMFIVEIVPWEPFSIRPLPLERQPPCKLHNALDLQAVTVFVPSLSTDNRNG
jgi:hypothetical protein